LGVLRKGYPESRNFASTSTRIESLQCVDVKDSTEILRKAWHRLSGTGYSKTLHSFAWLRDNHVDVVHTFNSVILGNIPWVVTFETTLPRESRLPKALIRMAWRHLASHRCLGILALSENARIRLLADLEENRACAGIDDIDAIRSKLRVLHPPQNTLINFSDKERRIDFNGSLQLILIGHDFFRKGGLELLVALDSLVEEGFDLRLCVVGKMNAGDYASRAGVKEVSRANQLISKHSARIEVKGTLPNENVKELLCESHVICLPSWGDTYGYSVLEGQAAACAAITTDLRAFSEINHNDCGWVVPVPKLVNGDGDLLTSSKRAQFHRILVDGLMNCLREALLNRDLLREKCRRSLIRIKRFHDPVSHAQVLEAIYARSLEFRSMDLHG
jgi:glycosyltransferase involved in cell wall biosynthesis